MNLTDPVEHADRPTAASRGCGAALLASLLVACLVVGILLGFALAAVIAP